MADLLLQFAENIGLAVVLTLAVGAATDRVAPRWPSLVQPINGALFGLLAVLFMTLPFEIRPGVILDLRNLVIFLAGPFAGPLAAAIAGAMSAAYRFYLGGAGALAGIGAILAATALGCFVGWKYGRITSWQSGALWGAVLGAVVLPWVLIIGEITTGLALLQILALPTIIFYVGGATLLSSIFMADQRRRQAGKLLAFNEQRFRDIAEMASDWFWEMDENLRVTYVSHRLREITGFGADHFQGKRRRDLVNNILRSELEAHEKILRERKPFRDFRYTLRTSDGEMREVLSSGKPVFDENGAFKGYRGSGRDISAETRFRQDMENARLNAELANKAKSDFLASMSHELRTPLNAIIGFSEIMKKEMFGIHSVPSYRGYAADINASAEYLLSLVNDILDVARVESGRVELKKSTCDLDSTVLSALRLLKERAAARDITLTTKIQPHLPMAFLDERAIKQVIVNIATNAVKFTKPGGSVAVTVGYQDDDGFLITVADTGVGIPANELPSVLRPFQQSANGRQVSKEGTGLGLPLSKAMVEAHGGRLELESALGVGTTVRIILPAEVAAPLAKVQRPTKRSVAC